MAAVVCRLVDSSPGRGAVAAGGRAAHGVARRWLLRLDVTRDSDPGCYGVVRRWLSLVSPFSSFTYRFDINRMCDLMMLFAEWGEVAGVVE